MPDIQAGDRVKIVKPKHPAAGQPGIVLGLDWLRQSEIAYVACATSHQGKVWPVYVLYPTHLELIARPDPGASARMIEEIIEACEDRRCPLRGIYPWAGPYRPNRKITG